MRDNPDGGIYLRGYKEEKSSPCGNNREGGGLRRIEVGYPVDTQCVCMSSPGVDMLYDMLGDGLPGRDLR